MQLTKQQVEFISKQIHNKWAANRKKQGWKYGEERNSEQKETPCLVPYNELPESEKEYDRELAKTTIDTIEDLGVKIVEQKQWFSKQAKKQILAELVAKTLHQHWMQMRKEAGWKHGKAYNEKELTHPNLKPFDRLHVDEKKMNIDTAYVTISELKKYGYHYYPKGSPKRNGRMWIDQILMKPIAVQIAWLLLILIVLTTFFVGLGSIANSWCSSNFFSQLPDVATQNPNFGDKLWYVFLRLFDAGSIKDGAPSWFAISIVLSGWIICGGFFIAIITNGYFERIKKIEKGIARYKLKDHCVIIGSDKIHLNIIRNIRSGKHSEHSNIKQDCKIVIFSSKDSEEIRNKLKAFLNTKEERNIIIYRGDRTSEDHLQNIWLHTAAEIFVLGENKETGSDSMNIACVGIISKILNYYRTDKIALVKPKPCTVLLDDLRTYDLLTEVELGTKKSLLQLSHFNNHDSWSSKLFCNNFSGFDLVKEQIRKHWKDRKVSYRFVIIGFNRMGESMLNQAIRTLQFGPDQNVNISVIDIKANSFAEKFRSRCPGFELLEKKVGTTVEFLPWDIESKTARKEIEKWVMDKTCTLLGIAVCFQDSTLSLYDGLKLPQLVDKKNIPVFIYQEELHGLAKSIQERNENKNKYISKSKLQHSAVSFFGMVNDSIYIFKEREKAAEAIQQRYQMFCSIMEQADKPYNKQWKDLAEKDKWANRYKTESAPIMRVLLELKYTEFLSKESKQLSSFEKSAKMSDLLEAVLYIKIFEEAGFVETVNEKGAKEWDITKSRLRIMGEKAKKFLSQENMQHYRKLIKNVNAEKLFEVLEYISETEHQRWMAEKIISGWNKNTKRINEQKSHPDLVEYTKLSELTKMYDRGGFL